MTDEVPKSQGGDFLGIRPLNEAALVVTKGAVDGAGAFLSRICLPAAEEFGFLLRDRVAAWRAKQMRSIEAHAERMYTAAFGGAEMHAHPRLVGAILEHGSWEDDPEVQEMWAGLLASSCSLDGRSQENLIFVNMLSNISSGQARVFAHACQNTQVTVLASGLPFGHGPTMDRRTLFELFGSDDLLLLDVALDHLREIGLLTLGGGLNPHAPDANEIEPSPLGLNFYARCQGHSGSILDFYKFDGPESSGPEPGVTLRPFGLGL